VAEGEWPVGQDPISAHVAEDGQTSPRQLARRYRAQILRNGRGHYNAAQAAIWKNRSLGALSAFISAAAGSTLLSTQGNSSTLVVLLAGGAGLLVSALAGLQTFLKYGELAAEHQAAGRRFAALRREFDILILRLDQEDEFSAQVELLAGLKQNWDQVSMESPLIPAWADRKAVREL
jgi:hypothetical protein